jgi:hypothetical protein
MDPGLPDFQQQQEWQDFRQQQDEDNGWNLEAVFDPNQILIEPLNPPLLPRQESELEDPDSYAPDSIH